MFKNLALRPKLVLIIMLVSAVTSVVLSTGVLFFDLISLRESLSHDLETVAEILGDNSTSALAFGDNRAASEVLKALQAEPRVVAACMYTYDGKPFARYVRSDYSSVFVPPPVGKDSNAFESGRFIQFHQIKHHGSTVGTLYIESDLGAMKERLRNYGVVVGLGMLVSSLLAYLLATRLQSMFSRPVLELVRTAKLISKENNYSLRASGTGKDEFGLLVTAFNGMLGQIQRRDLELESQQAELQREVEGRTAVNVQLQSAKALAETANKTKSEFLANMSHEIRTPINGILGMIELALETGLTADQREYLVLGRSSGESLLAIINDILDFSKIESGKLEVECIPFDLVKSVGETLKLQALRAHQKNLELLCEVSSDVPAEVLGDPGRLRQILLNLIGNAIKFTEKGEVLLEVTVQHRAPPNIELRFKVSDSGIGIPKKKQSLLFQAFHQADGSITRRYGGTGLGLAISARLAELMGGKITVDSSESKGSVFSLTTRLLLPARSSSPMVRPLRPELLGARLLIIDDNATMREIAHRMTLQWGMRPFTVASMADALEVLDRAHAEKDPFRAIMLDAHMTGIDGLQFATALRERSGPSTALIILLSSGLPDADMPYKYEKLGCATYLLKPILEGELLQAITRLLDPPPLSADIPSLDPSAAETLGNQLTVLVAEDNMINQTLMVRLLQKLGHVSVLARNGREALELARLQKFDLILMDVQMPEMDGLTATAAIREAEKSSGGHTPIFAITARAMKGDRELCLKAGMDGYISKPVNFAEVERALATVSLNHSLAPVAHPQAWTGNAALDRLGGDEELLREMCAIFLRESPKLLHKLRQAVENGDAEAAQGAAHSIKGEVGCLGAEHVTGLAKRLERMAEERDLSGAATLITQLDTEVAQLYVAVREKIGVAQ